MKTHEGKMWDCSYCGKKFTTKYFLKKHRRLHTGKLIDSSRLSYNSFLIQARPHILATFVGKPLRSSSPSTSTCSTTRTRSLTRAHGRIVGKLSRSCRPCRTTRGSTQVNALSNAQTAPKLSQTHRIWPGTRPFTLARNPTYATSAAKGSLRVGRSMLTLRANTPSLPTPSMPVQQQTCVLSTLHALNR